MKKTISQKKLILALVHFQKKFIRSVREGVEDYQKVGLMLSGGLDSSAVAAGLHQCGKRFQAYSADFSHIQNNKEINEIKYQKIVW